MATTISTDIVAIITLCFTIWLARRNMVISRYKNQLYISAAATIILILILEIATILMALSSNANLVIPHRIANMLGFSLSPVVPFILLFFHWNKKNSVLPFALAIGPLILNALICIFSYNTGWIFFVNAQNQYTRGDLFLLPGIVSIFYFILMVAVVVKNSNDYDVNDKQVLIPLFILPIAALAVQVVFPDIICLWSSISISLLLYYIFLRELQFKYDVQTGVRNRTAFEKEMRHYAKEGKDAVIVVLDINNLKLCNDRYGHEVGDEVIISAAQIIHDSFSSIGHVFRIGGDEFCVICPEKTQEKVDNACCKLEHLLTSLNQERTYKISLAYGYAFYQGHGKKDIYAAFAQADQAMYTHKAKLKGLYGRRFDDN
ncbi:MAG TPA: GGDEF domain-containing protein [Syntrophomonadaceae bacterium]|nr:GGDEF domain-containing protein [Syntrophomonadaceae bacterium]HQA07331.1 GGDEF domain-containing protein [Syntrophomonadaceae bacterium]HQE23330.1 GGDEF domain-containing protein [Syntrophomonadaceae bacterium]